MVEMFYVYIFVWPCPPVDDPHKSWRGGGSKDPDGSYLCVRSS